jgi:DNA invertase Pin-like site-specific DNA recombinase
VIATVPVHLVLGNKGRLILTIFSGFAEFERDLIVERTKEGKAIAKQKPGFREGRPRTYTEKLDLLIPVIAATS